jgi:hypothetical protein
MIDCDKIRDGLESLVKAVQTYKTEEQQRRRSAVDMWNK